MHHPGTDSRSAGVAEPEAVGFARPRARPATRVRAIRNAPARPTGWHDLDMTEYQIMSWREIPSLVTFRDGDETLKVQLAPRFQEAVDEAAMRLGAVGSDDYLAGWARGDWTPVDGDLPSAAEAVSADLESRWDQAALDAYLDGLGPAAS